MKKEQFRTMVKEIIKEVISEIETEVDEGQNAYPAGGINDPKIDAKNQAKKDWAAKKASLDTLKNPNPSNKTPFFKGSADEGKQHSQYPAGGDEKIKSRQDSWKKWGQGMKTLKGIHDEPDFKAKQSALRKKNFDDSPES